MELHVAGVLARARPLDTETVAARISSLPGAEVHATSADGKLVVTLEASDAPMLSERLARIPLVAGVLSAVLVYQHCEEEEDMGDGST
ncbi:MAG TPA: chaperone NapD [Aromatoleum sp.]|uniref:chaperone NapD n=1 Tax=Aromatoleum sp. TaxID=2307007 RepID=UPI002B4A01A6|nr:chaperone NapD [Aromatoleum sp.]HJV27373.1 chaperone NapD [Aromatoleum sp.]